MFKPRRLGSVSDTAHCGNHRPISLLICRDRTFLRLIRSPGGGHSGSHHPPDRRRLRRRAERDLRQGFRGLRRFRRRGFARLREPSKKRALTCLFTLSRSRIADRRNQHRPVSLCSKIHIVAPLRSAIGNLALSEPQSMEKLHDMIDTVFGDINQKPAPQAPSDAAVQRDQAFAAAASKIEKLKQARLQAQSRQ